MELGSCDRGHRAYKAGNIYHLALYKKSLPTSGLDAPALLCTCKARTFQRTACMVTKPIRCTVLVPTRIDSSHGPPTCVTCITLHSRSPIKATNIPMTQQSPCGEGAPSKACSFHTTGEQNRSHLLCFAFDLAGYLAAFTDLQLLLGFLHVLLYSLPVNFDVPGMVCKLEFQ